MALLAPSPPNPYTTAADTVTAIPTRTSESRESLGITTKTQAAQIGIGEDTLIRLESGSVPTQTTILRCLRWLAVNGGQ